MDLKPMIEPRELQVKGLRKWPLFLRAALGSEPFFPFELSLGTPQGLELLDEFAAVQKWIMLIRDFASHYDLEIREKTIQHRQIGSQTLPSHLIIKDQDSYLRWVDKNLVFRSWLAEAELTMRDFPSLQEWLFKNVETLEKNIDIWPSIRAVLSRFKEGEVSHLYLRELDIAWVDTKFIEKNRMLLDQLLTLILPADRVRDDIVASNASRFCQKFGLKFVQSLVRFRWLEAGNAPAGLTDMSLPLDDFISLRPDVEKVFITENKVNGLSFPPMKGSIVIFGLGGGLDILREVGWLKDKRLFYWGDIDTHGFILLARLRKYFPGTESLLMDAETFQKNKIFWVKESVAYGSDFDRCALNAEELSLLDAIYADGASDCLRLEQERIPYSQVQSALESRFDN